MKMIDCHAPYTLNNNYLNVLRLFYYYEEQNLEIYTPKLSECCGSIIRFYYRLVYVIYNMLDKDTLYEDD